MTRRGRSGRSRALVPPVQGRLHNSAVDTIEIEGEWWLPGDSSRSVSGTLRAEQNSFRLVLHGALQAFQYPEPEEGSHVVELQGQEWVKVPIFHGHARDRQAVTIMNADGLNSNYFETMIAETYDIDIALFGDHIDTDEFIATTFQIDCLDAWLWPQPSLVGESGRIPNLSILGQMPLELHRVEHGNSRVEIRVDAVGTYDASAIYLDRSTSITVRPGEILGWREMLDKCVRPLQDLLTVATGRPCQLNWIDFHSAHPSGLGESILQGRFRSVQPQALHTGELAPQTKVDDLLGYSSPTIVMAKDIRGQVPDLIAGWLTEWRENSELIALLIGHMYAPFIYTSHRFGSIFQAIEGLHSVLCPMTEVDKASHVYRVDKIAMGAREAGVPEADVVWAERVLKSRNDKPLRQRVQELIDVTGPLGEILAAKAPNFASDATKLRTSVSHPRGGRIKFSQARYYWFGDVLLWVARSIFLNRAGLSDSYERVAGKASFQHAVSRLADV